MSDFLTEQQQTEIANNVSRWGGAIASGGSEAASNAAKLLVAGSNNATAVFNAWAEGLGNSYRDAAARAMFVADTTGPAGMRSAYQRLGKL
jgi:hypothetical protein